ncbi:hypothetical protein DFQ28_011486 [Apophysomyces sp. BC1034]|nr:hypothetical protein DFQ30_011496 [Apophysomyces sp. BC1015]KAG0168719.1 hypothetical protein DFQ29_010046 [Apophysomyces sp. BC1021]KAG0184263.1 hypothetical protein DFQ28_011486 [Apophysomyces sp. BC1034]
MSSSYIVTFKKDTPNDVIEEHIKQTEAGGAEVTHRYPAIKGYAVKVPDDVVSTTSFTGPHIEMVEADGEVTTQGALLLNQ